jgi:XRE family transcriptional regulator, regulator of sulfur utilization
MNIGSSIRYFRLRRGFSQEKLAEALGSTASYISLIENSQRQPGLPMVERIASKLEVPVPILMFFAMDENDVAPDKRDFFSSSFEMMKQLVLSSLSIA